MTADCDLVWLDESGEGPVGAPACSTVLVMTKLTSPGWLLRSAPFGPPTASDLVSGNAGAATTNPMERER